MADVKLGGQPTKPPPDPNKPYLWIGDQWVLIYTDTSDGVPADLDYVENRPSEGPRK